MHQTNWKRPLTLAATLLALGTLAIWLEFKHKPAKESAEELSKKIFAIKDTPIQGIKISDGSKKFELTCSDFSAKLCKPGDNSKWQLGEPVQTKADDTSVNSLLSALNSLVASDVIDLKDETPEKRAALLREYGLDPSSREKTEARRLAITTATGTVQADLGLTHPIGEGIFALVEKDGKADETRVYVVPSYFKTNLEHDLTYWRDKKLFGFAAHDITSFKLDGTKAHLSAEKREGQWVLRVGSDEFAGDPENIDNLLSAVAFLTAKQFVTDDKSSPKAKTSLQGTKTVVTLLLQKDKGTDKEVPTPVTLKLFEKAVPSGKKNVSNARLFATVSNASPLYELDSFSKDRVDKSVADLRLSKLITSMERFSAKRLEFAGAPIGAPPLVLVNKDGQWTNGADLNVSNEKIQTTLDKLSGNRIKEFVQAKAIPGGEGDGLRVILGDEKNEKKRELVFWKSGEKLFARDLQSKRNEAFVVDPAIKEDLPWTRTFYKKTDAASDKSKK